MNRPKAISHFRRPRSVNAKIFRATAIVGALSVLVKAIATMKEVAVAGFFGRGDVVDAFLMAFMLPLFMVNLIAATFNTALVPTYIEVRARDGQIAAQELVSSAFLISQGLLLGIGTCLAVLAPQVFRLLASNFSPEKYSLTLHLFYLMLPVILLSGIATNCGAVLNANGEFALPVLASLCMPAVTLLVLVILGHGWGIWSVALGVVTGSLCEATIDVIALHKKGIRVLPKWYGTTPALRQVRSQYIPLLVAGAMGTGITMVDQSMAAWLQPGSLAALSYGGRIVTVIVGLAGTSLNTALIPYFSEMIARQDWGGCKHTLKTYSRLMLMTMVPVCALLIAGSSVIVRLLYQHGAFTAADTLPVAGVQAMYALGIPFYAVSVIHVRLLMAMKRNALVMISSGINLALDVPFNILGMHLFGVAGIALSTSIYYAGSLLFLIIATKRVLRQVSPPFTHIQEVASEFA